MFQINDIAALFSVSRGTVFNWITHGKLDAVKIVGTIRVPHEAILKFIANNGKGFVNTGKKAITARMVSSMRGRIGRILKGQVKKSSSMKLIGCSPEKFSAHIEKQFHPGMSFDNYGLSGWVIDHIIPCAQFDLSIHEHQKICFHYTNLQPMWAIDNWKKGKKITRRSVGKYFINFHTTS